MRRWLKFFVTLVLALSIAFSAVSITSYAASTAADQKQTAKKFNKFLKKYFYSDDIQDVKISYKKTGKRYTFTMTFTTKNITKDMTNGVNANLHQQLLTAFAKTSKSQYKNAKKMGLKKPIVRVIWITADGYKVASIKNGTLE